LASSTSTSPLVDVSAAWLNFRPEFAADESDRLRAAEPYLMKTGEPSASPR
jgi:hypothetical protein